MINKIIIFEGIDRTGKTTLKKLYFKIHPEDMLIDRLFVSGIVYDKFYARKSNTDFLLFLINVFKNISIIVYVFCSYDV